MTKDEIRQVSDALFAATSVGPDEFDSPACIGCGTGMGAEHDDYCLIWRAIEIINGEALRA